jgi:hypothetical protein
MDSASPRFITLCSYLSDKDSTNVVFLILRVAQIELCRKKGWIGILALLFQDRLKLIQVFDFLDETSDYLTVDLSLRLC